MRRLVPLTLATLSALGGCKPASTSDSPEAGREAQLPSVVTDTPDAARTAASGLKQGRRLRNRVAYIPPQCFTKTRGADGKPKNPCYACHTRSEAPNYVNDDDLQLTLTFPEPATRNPWSNLRSPPIARAPAMSDEEVLAYVRESNYFDTGGQIALTRALEKPPPDWDTNGNGRWDGFTPDVRFAFDAQGFDHGSDGALNGWRAFAYYPFVGTFFPTNGSTDDVLIRLDPAMREDAAGRFDLATYILNLAIVEALIRRADVAIDPIDETGFGVDVDLDGRLDRATHVKFDAAPDGRGGTRMHYVGRAHDLEARGDFPIAPGLFPLHTEFFHTVRYLDVGPDGVVTMAPRMKEARYARKVQWFTYEQLETHVGLEKFAAMNSTDRTHSVLSLGEAGVSNEQGWDFQGFIEARDGSLRPQSVEESAFCEGCHGGIGATTDGIFSFARKLGDGAPAHGWFHWSQHGLRGLPEPKRGDGQYEYSLYLHEAGAGDELRSNTEVLKRFFDDHGELRPGEVSRPARRHRASPSPQLGTRPRPRPRLSRRRPRPELRSRPRRGARGEPQHRMVAPLRRKDRHLASRRRDAPRALTPPWNSGPDKDLRTDATRPQNSRHRVRHLVSGLAIVLRTRH